MGRRFTARLLVTGAFLILAACGGGDGATLAPAAPNALPFISVSLTSSTNAFSVPARTSVTASAQVADQSPFGAPLNSATVRINGNVLTLDPASNRYSGAIDTVPGAAITIDVAVNGASYTAATTLLSGAPTLTSPPPLLATTWNAAVDNLIQWTNAAGSDATAFGASVAAISNAFPPTAVQVWPATGGIQTVASGATSVVVPRNSLSPCRCFVSIIASRLTSFPGAASSSSVAVFAAATATVTVN